MAMTAAATLDFKFGQMHIDYMRRCRTCEINVAEGAVRAGKTVDNVFAFAAELETAPDKFHLASGATIGNAKLNIGVCNGYGLEAQFRGRCHWGRYRDNDCLYINTPTGEKIVIFAGGGVANSFSKIRGNSYGMWIATEINQHHDTFIKEAFNRQLAAKRIKVFWDLNPSNPTHPIYTDYIDKYAEKQKAGVFPSGYNYQHFTIFDNATLPPERVQEIISKYDEDSIWYARDILGKRMRAEGLVYPMFSRSKNVVYDIPEYNRHHSYYVSIDYGTVNPFAAGLWDVDEVARTATMVRELYYDGGTRNRVDNETYYRMLCDLIGDIPIQYIVIDPSASSMIETIQKYGDYLVTRADNDVLNGIQDVTEYINSGKLRICSNCTNTLNEFEAYCWDESKDEDVVLKENDHAMDMIRYFVRTVLRNMWKWIV
mgnify:CR=1 FL=1